MEIRPVNEKQIITDPENMEQRTFNPSITEFSESESRVKGFEGRQFTLRDSDGNHIGDLLLVRDADDDSWVKIKIFGIDDKYKGLGAANVLYEKSFEIAREDKKDLVMDSAVGLAAYKSFTKYLDSKGYKYEENPLNAFHQPTQTYQAADLTYTIRIKNEVFK